MDIGWLTLQFPESTISEAFLPLLPLRKFLNKRRKASLNAEIYFGLISKTN
jgi:hypothetical protein